jgi:signal transduction histidine kinase
VSHELKSPLTSIRGAAELLRDDDDNQPMTKVERRCIENIIADAERLDRLLVRLRELAYAEVPIPADQVCADDICIMLQERFPDLQVVADGYKKLHFALPIEAANVVFGNLAQNALQNGATRLDLIASTGARSVTILVRDNGVGISEANRQHVFRPFFSTRRQDGGTGMGLGIARTMLTSHGGEISLMDGVRPGTEFAVVVPLR